MFAAMSAKSLSCCALCLAAAYLVFFAAPFLWVGIVEGDGGALFGAFLGAPWLAAPIFAAAVFVGASSTRSGGTSFLLLELALAVAGLWFFFTGVLHGNSTAVLGLLIWPFVQWGAVLIAFLVAMACGWRMRPDYLKD
jgi:hypothetical protein